MKFLPEYRAQPLELLLDLMEEAKENNEPVNNLASCCDKLFYAYRGLNYDLEEYLIRYRKVMEKE